MNLRNIYFLLMVTSILLKIVQLKSKFLKNHCEMNFYPILIILILNFSEKEVVFKKNIQKIFGTVKGSKMKKTLTFW